MIDSRKIIDLTPKVAELCNQFVIRCKENGISVSIISTYRDYEKQNQLYSLGRTEPGKKVTNAKAGQSMHNFRVAFDFAPTINGVIDWNNMALFNRCGEIAESVGLEWGGRWKTIKDYGHCQYTGGFTLADLRKIKEN